MNMTKNIILCLLACFPISSFALTMEDLKGNWVSRTGTVTRPSGEVLQVDNNAFQVQKDPQFSPKGTWYLFANFRNNDTQVAQFDVKVPFTVDTTTGELKSNCYDPTTRKDKTFVVGKIEGQKMIISKPMPEEYGCQAIDAYIEVELLNPKKISVHTKDTASGEGRIATAQMDKSDF